MAVIFSCYVHEHHHHISILINFIILPIFLTIIANDFIIIIGLLINGVLLINYVNFLTPSIPTKCYHCLHHSPIPHPNTPITSTSHFQHYWNSTQRLLINYHH